MKKVKNLSLIVLTAAFLFQSCIGSFNLTRTVYDWNRNIGDKFVNELVFLACIIVPVYGVATIVDAVVLNSIEFWSGSNPMALKDGEKHQQLIEMDGKTYQLTSEKYKMTVEELGVNGSKTVMVFREEDNSWYLKKGKKLQKLVEVKIQDEQIMSYQLFMPDGTSTLIEPGFDRLAVQDQLNPQPALALQ